MYSIFSLICEAAARIDRVFVLIGYSLFHSPNIALVARLKKFLLLFLEGSQVLIPNTLKKFLDLG